MMHPLVRDLYKRVIIVGRDYPVPWPKMRETWKKALRDPNNCPSCYDEQGRLIMLTTNNDATTLSPECAKEIRRAVGRGRYMVREMIGVIQLKKYRAMKQRYSNDNNDDNNHFPPS